MDSECISKAEVERPDLVLLETNGSPGIALQLCRSLRSEKETKSLRIAVWSAGLERLGRMEFYEAGADDVVTEAVIGSESLMRLTANARRSLFEEPHLSFADLVLFPDQHLARRCGKSISLSRFQIQLLQFLMENPGIVFSRDDLSQRVWKGLPIHGCSISTAVNRLKRLLNLPDVPDLIHTVRGSGYVLRAQ